MFSSDILAQIQENEVISFDIFDTLLLRPYAAPTDLFKHVEKISGATGFYDARISAENLARKNCKSEEITFDEIYNLIDEKFAFCKELELQLEYQTLKKNEEIFEIYQEAINQQKKIVIISNMYLSANFLKDVLHKNGYTQYHKLYVSSEYRLSKNTSNLFKLALNELNVAPNKMLHIGDNPHDDFNMAHKAGLNAIVYPKVLSQFFNDLDNRYIEDFYQNNKNNFEAGIIVSLCAWQWLKNKKTFNENYWYNLGFRLAGPVIYGFTKYIINQSQYEDELVFVGRDGYTLQKVYDIIAEQKKKNFYLYAPRIFNLNCLFFDFDNFKYLDAAIDIWKEKEQKFAQLLPTKFSNFQSKKSWFIKNKNIIETKVKQNIANYLAYFKQCGINFHKKIAIVDTLTGSFSAQNFLENLFYKKITGIYWGVNAPENICKNYAHHKYAEKYGIDPFWDLFEIFITSPEYPVIDIQNNKVVYNNQIPTLEKLFRDNIYPQIADGAIDFSKMLKNTFSKFDLEFSHEMNVSLISFFTQKPSKNDLIYFQQLQSTVDFKNQNYRSLTSIFSHKRKSKYTIHYRIYLFKYFPLVDFYQNISDWKLNILSLIPLLKKKTSDNKMKLYLFGLPLLTLKDTTKYKKIYLFKILLIKMKHAEENYNV